MPRFLLLLILLFSGLSLSAQERIFERKLKLASASAKSYESGYAFDEANRKCYIVLHDTKNIEVLLFDMNFQFIENYSFSKASGNDLFELHETIVDNGILKLYFTDHDGLIFTEVSIDYSLRKLKQNTVLNLMNSRDVLITTFVYNNEVKAVVVPRNKSLIKVLSCRESIVDTTIFDFSSLSFTEDYFNASFYDALNFQVKAFKSYIEIGKITTDQSFNFIHTSKDCKMYLYGNKLYATINTIERYTLLLMMDLESGQATYKPYEQAPADVSAVESYTTNSLLVQNFLVQAVVTPKQLALTVTDIRNNSQMGSFLIGTENELSVLSNSSISSDGLAFDKKIETTAEFIEKMSASYVNLAYATLGDTAYELYVGAYELIRGVDYSRPLQFSGTSNTYTLEQAPADEELPRGFRRYSFSISMHFASLFDQQAFQHQTKPDASTLIDKIKSTTENRYISGEVVFRRDGHYYYGYFSRHDNYYYIFKI